MDPMIEAGMRIAIEEARVSLREGYRGVGAVILKGRRMLVREHDTEGSEPDLQAHAEARAIQKASRLAGGDLSECLLLSTREPCAQCLEEIRQARLASFRYGYGTAGAEPSLPEALSRECALLYNEEVREELKRLRGVSDLQLRELNHRLTGKRLDWFQRKQANFRGGAGDVLELAYRMLLAKLDIGADQAPVVVREKDRIVFHSMNFCATLEASRILDLDTRRICRLGNEGATDALVRQLDPRLRFRRNYEKIRPYCPYCEERIELAGAE